jgi:hypothetical protein
MASTMEVRHIIYGIVDLTPAHAGPMFLPQFVSIFQTVGVKNADF